MWKDGDSTDVALKSNFVRKTMPDLANNENFLSMIEHVINTENKVQVNTTDIYHYYKQDHYNYSFVSHNFYVYPYRYKKVYGST